MVAVNKIKKLITLLSLAFLSACGSSTVIDNCSKKEAEVFLELVSFNVQNKANNDSAVAVDLVILYDKTLTNTFLGMSASSYFKKKKQLILDYPIQMQVKSWEAVPGQKITPYAVKLAHPLPQAAFFYANYSTSGDHRQRVGNQAGLQVVLGKTDMSLRELSNTEIQALFLSMPKTTHPGLSSTAQQSGNSNCCCCCNSSCQQNPSGNTKTTRKTTPSSTNKSSSANTNNKAPSSNKGFSNTSLPKAQQQAANRAQAAQDVAKDLAAAQQKVNRAQAAQDVAKDLAAAQQKVNRTQDAKDIINDLSSVQQSAQKQVNSVNSLINSSKKTTQTLKSL